MKPGRSWQIAATVLSTVCLAALFANFLGPYSPAEQHRDAPFAAPMGIHFIDSSGRWRIRPFIIDPVSGRSASLRFFSRGRLLAVDPPAHVFLLGSDEYGRDQFSRLLNGGRLSLSAGLVATFLSLSLAVILGVPAGFLGEWWDSALMRGAELFLALPWLYLLLAVRAFLPLSLAPAAAFMMLTGITGILGWARPARLVRGVTLSLRQRPFVEAAHGFGASPFYLARRHILPGLRSVLWTQAALLVPQYILAEVTLSFLGLGINEPAVSWGAILGAIRHTALLTLHPWIALPALLLIPVFVCFQICADALARS